MVDMKAGLLTAVATVVVLIIELLLFPIVLVFMDNLNSTARGCSAGVNCSGEWITASDRTLLTNVPTLLIVIVLFTVLGGMIASIFMALKG